MAANEYYDPPLRQQADSRHGIDAYPPRLPPLPIQQYTSLHQDRPHDSPLSPDFDSTPLYQPHRTASEESTLEYFSAGRAGRSEDVRQHSDEIPLREHPQPIDEHSSIMKHQALPQDELPSPAASQPRRRRHRESKKKGFFSWETTWAVYILTLIQLAVFIAELVKNGRLRARKDACQVPQTNNFQDS